MSETSISALAADAVGATGRVVATDISDKMVQFTAAEAERYAPLLPPHPDVEARRGLMAWIDRCPPIVVHLLALLLAGRSARSMP